MGILLWIIFGFVVGLIARALMPGRQSMGYVMTTLLGIAGSFVGGLIASWITRNPAQEAHGAGMIGSVLGALLLLFLFGSLARRRRAPT
jgi:uncharacterized membrane protein YeaQ/YmgE (transglycosylase-associated protein family)